MKRSGNALFLILIAVALFAALSYAVTQSGRGGGNIDREQAVIQTANLMQFYTQVQSTVDRMLLNGCAKGDISYEGADTGGFAATDYDNATTPADGRCRVFDPAGGGLTYQPPSNEILDQSQSANTHFGHTYFIKGSSISILNGDGSHAHYMITPFVSEAACREVSVEIVGSENISSDTGTANINPSLFDGESPLSSGGPPFNCNGSPFMPIQACGRLTGCVLLEEFQGNGTPHYMIFQQVFRDPP